MSDVFLSYASADRQRVAPLVRAIERGGWTVWWDRNIEAGTAFDREIERALDAAQCVVVAWSNESVESDWVRSEATEGLERGVLVPVLLDPVRPPLAFRRTQTIDLCAGVGAPQGLLDAILRLCPTRSSTNRNAAPLVGRRPELDALRDRVRRAQSGEGAFVLLSGEAGVGKSRLVQEISGLASAGGMLVLTGRCEADAAPPYQPLVNQIEQALRQLPAEDFRRALGEDASELARLVPGLRRQFSDIDEPVELPPEQERRYLLRACGEFVARAAGGQPLLMVFEDLHWAGESTCRLLAHLAEHLRESAVLLVGTLRDTDLEDSAAFARTLPELVRQRWVAEIPLGRLDAGEVHALLAGRAGQAPPDDLVALVAQATDGNPFFVEEMYRYLDETGRLFRDDGQFVSGSALALAEVPRGIRLTIEQRLVGVSGPCRRMLTNAALAGRVFDFTLLAAISGLARDELFDAIEEAERLSLVDDVSVGREARYQFVHELTRQTLIASLSLPRRQQTHLDVADALEANAAARETRVADIAFHLFSAGSFADSERTYRCLLSASERALEAVAFEDCLQLLDQALEVAAGDAPEPLARIQGLRARALRGAVRIPEAIGALEAALASVANGAREGPLEVELLLQRAQLLVDLYRGEAALPDLQQLLQIAGVREDTGLELTAQRLLADAHYRISLDNPDHAVLARLACERTIELARSAGDHAALAGALLLSADFVDYWADYREQIRENLEEATVVAELLDDEALRLDCASMKLRVATVSPLEFSVAAEDVLRRIEARRDPIRLKEHLFCMIHPVRNAGYLERSVQLCDRAIEVAQLLGVPPVQYPTLRSHALVALGRLDEAWQSITEEVAGDGYRFAAALQRYGFFLYRGQLQDVDGVLELAPPLLEECRALNRVWMIQAMADLVASMSARGGRLEDGLSLLEREAPEIELGPEATAEVALARGAASAALAQARALSRSCAAAGMHLLAADADDLAIRCLLEMQCWSEVVELADRQVDYCRGIGYEYLLWRELALRAQAQLGLGDRERAAGDLLEAREHLESMAMRIPNMAVRSAFLAQPLATAVLQPRSG